MVKLNEEWLRYFINIAEQVKLKSKDRSTQIGAVIVGKDKEIRSTGYNSFPRGLDDEVPERQERPEKYYFFEHSERNAIYNAARVGIPLDESVIIVTSGIPCADCARAIINSGIKAVYCKSICTTKNKEKWNESQEKALQMLKECKVDVIFYD
ncbi:MAG TPA: deaminase [Bacilli bacterium]|jgi:dCMP deaminase|nr:deaminase [Bacilli bacterium]